MFAQVRRHHPSPTQFVQSDGDAVEAEREADDRAEAVGHGMQQHLLPGHHRETRRELDHHLRWHRRQGGPDAERFADVHQAVRHAGHDQVLTDLPGGRRPSEHAGRGIERGAFGQAPCGIRQHRRRIRIGAMDREFQCVTQLDRVVGHLQRGGAVDIGDRQQHRDLALGAGRIEGRKTQRVVARLRIPRGPAERARARVETRTGRQC